MKFSYSKVNTLNTIYVYLIKIPYSSFPHKTLMPPLSILPHSYSIHFAPFSINKNNNHFLQREKLQKLYYFYQTLNSSYLNKLYLIISFMMKYTKYLFLKIQPSI